MRHHRLLLCVFPLALAACREGAPAAAQDLAIHNAVLVPETGDSPLDQQIRHVQEQVKTGSQRPERLVQLAILFIQKARRLGDSGYYKLAEQCATWIETESS